MVHPPLLWPQLGVRQPPLAAVHLNYGLRSQHGRRLTCIVFADTNSRDYRRGSYKDSNGIPNEDVQLPRDEREISVTQRERQLWERQERMYEREMARWDQERQYWHQREAMLLQHISKLHTGLLTLAQLQAKQLPAPEGEEGPPGESTARARAALETDRDMIDAVVDQMELASISNDSSHDDAPAEAQAGKLADRARSSIGRDKVSAEVREEVEVRFRDFGSQGWDESDSENASLASQFESAISAVDKVDILRDEPNFLEVDYSRQEVSSGGNGFASRDFSISRRQVSAGKEDEEDELEKQMLKALEEIAEMVGESETAVGEILEATLPASATTSEEPPRKDGPSKSGFAPLFQSAAAKPDVGAGQTERDSGSVTVPTLVMGADDIFWVSTLHSALNDRGYHCGDEEEEDMFFGDGTFSALITFQACAGLPETGVCNMSTWRALLGDKLETIRPPPPSSEADARVRPGTTSQSLASSPRSEPAPVAAPAAYAAPPPTPTPQPPTPAPPEPAPASKVITKGKRLWAALFASDEELPDNKPVSPASSASSTQSEPPRDPSPEPEPQASPDVKKNALDRWPILREGDGGTHVHQLHCALGSRGYHCGEDDEVWWQFGDATYSALVAFQACNSLPESGVADHETWVALLGNQAHPRILGTLRHGDHRDDDMLGKHHEGMVFLIGEQRWATRRVSK
eukprot:jgi/Botrbrau1/2524/Bobra.0079s0015.2